VAKGPEEPKQNKVAEDRRTETAAEPDERYEKSSDPRALAYLRLNGGAAEIVRSGTRVQALDGLQLESGDRVMVTTGTVYVTYPDSGASRLEAGTDIVLTTDDSKPGLVMQLELVAGRIWTRFERVFGSGEYYAVSANNVVATVRGTAFGMSIEDGAVDVQVADHEVAVTAEQGDPLAWRAGTVPRFLKLSAGQGLRIATRGALPDIQLLGASIRQLSVAERLAEGFKFGASRLLPERLRPPTEPVRLKIEPVMTPELIRYRELLLRRAAIMQAASSTFVAPQRAPSLQETAPTTSPKILGPSG
jgi:hypothetical protein